MTIPRGKVVAIMGISGGGKTTTLRLIGGQIKATSGTVRVDGRDVADLRGKALYDLRRRMGMLFQFGALFTDMSLSIIGELIRALNDALGASSIIVTHDVQESLKIVDYIYIVSGGRIVAEGTADDIRQSRAEYVHQFVWGEADGPVAFHYPAPPYRDEIHAVAGHA